MNFLCLAFTTVSVFLFSSCLPYIPISSDSRDKIISNKINAEGQIVETIICKIKYIEKQYLTGPDGPARRREISSAKIYLNSSNSSKRLTFVEDFNPFSNIIPVRINNNWIALDFQEDKDDRDKPDRPIKYDKKGSIRILIFNREKILRKDIISDCRRSYFLKNGRHNFSYNESNGQLIFNMDGEQIIYSTIEISIH